AVSALRRAVELTQDSHPDKPAWFNNLGNSFLARFERAGELEDLEQAISTHRRAVELTPDNHPDKLSRYNNLGNSFLTRFERTGDFEDLEQAISMHRCAVELMPDDHPAKPSLFTNLGNSFLSRFERTKQAEDLEQAVSAHRNAVDLTPDDHPDKPSRFNNLGNSFLTRFERNGERDDLARAIAAHLLRRAVELTRDGDLDKPSRLNNLGNALLTRFGSEGELEDLGRAILAHRQAVDLTPDDDFDLESRLNSLGSSLLTRFGRTNKLEDLEQGISIFRRAVDLTPDGHPDKPICLNNLGNSLYTCFQHYSKLENLDEAILAHRRVSETTPDGDFNKPVWLSNLGGSLLARFERTGETTDLEQAISAHSRAIDLTPDGNPDKPSRLNNLGNSLLRDFQRYGELEHLDQAISEHTRAVNLTPDGHPDKSRRYHNLGNSLLTRFERTGELEDIERAISAHRHAVELIPLGHPDKPWRFNSLGSSLLTRYERLGEVEDIVGAISALRRAVELTPNGHTDKPSRLNNLGVSLSRRFRRVGELDDLQNSIVAYRRAVELTTDDHPQKPAILAHLCQNLCIRFERIDDPSDIEDALAAGRHAIALLPEGHPHLITCWNSLAIGLQTRFEHTGNIDDIKTAISMLQKTVSLVSSTTTSSGSPLVRLRSARRCAAVLSKYPTFNATGTMLSAYSRIITIIPETVWLGHDIHRRYEDSSLLGELVNNAVSVAVAAGALAQAVEWLEAGRALVWAQVLSLRSPLDELHGSHPELADSLRAIRQRLQSSAYNSSIPDINAFDGIDGLSVNSAADSHRGLVIEYDDLLKKIRARPGFEAFLRPKSLAALLPPTGLTSGPVVFINVDASRCDALILSSDGCIVQAPLSDLSMDRAVKLRRLWVNQLKLFGVRKRAVVQMSESRDAFTYLARLLKFMWNWIVQPVLHSLQLLPDLNIGAFLPHITWCPTGPLTQLPLHAAGIYIDPLGPRTFNFVVSSYTPSLFAIQRCCEGATKQHPDPSVLIVTQPATPQHSLLPGTDAEGVRLKEILTRSQIAAERLNHDKATVTSVNDAMSRYSWVHLACHGLQNSGDAIQSAFALYDGRLTLSALMGTVVDEAELAFLSACQTATGDEKNPEEAAHLAAGMLAVGFKGVVATMWSIGDADAPIVVEAYYNKLLELRSSGTVTEGETGAAYALHEAVKVLREEVGEDKFISWIPYVHFGV
ncbi:hypothetical protein PENSPDRAFT_573858, partial [Peniophora sp. CONT]